MATDFSLLTGCTFIKEIAELITVKGKIKTGYVKQERGNEDQKSRTRWMHITVTVTDVKKMNIVAEIIYVVCHIQSGSYGISGEQDIMFGLVFFMILLVLCVCLWKTRLRERSILFGTAQPPYKHKNEFYKTFTVKPQKFLTMRGSWNKNHKCFYLDLAKVYCDDFVTSVPDSADDLYYSRNHKTSVDHPHPKPASPPSYDEAIYMIQKKVITSVHVDTALAGELNY
ncbi:hypothetical protein KUTeg_008081 [Tegillarca granosa]|uniref:Uncharacterized protein n=1 Tax=Tegillarca granosa TaxID=220873 RepID=A0ABQ9F828_TEGGR|nr:hypothetical protein KUTeg_008081 [Tegillarca granosa]